MNDGMLQRQSKTTTIDEMCRLSNSYIAADVVKIKNIPYLDFIYHCISCIKFNFKNLNTNDSKYRYYINVAC